MPIGASSVCGSRGVSLGCSVGLIASELCAGQQRVAIRPRLRDIGRGDRRRTAHPVLNDDALADRSRQPVGGQSHRDVGLPARRIGVDDGDWARRKGSCARAGSAASGRVARMARRPRCGCMSVSPGWRRVMGPAVDCQQAEPRALPSCSLRHRSGMRRSVHSGCRHARAVASHPAEHRRALFPECLQAFLHIRAFLAGAPPSLTGRDIQCAVADLVQRLLHALYRERCH